MRDKHVCQHHTQVFPQFRAVITVDNQVDEGWYTYVPNRSFRMYLSSTEGDLSSFPSFLIFLFESFLPKSGILSPKLARARVYYIWHNVSVCNDAYLSHKHSRGSRSTTDRRTMCASRTTSWKKFADSKSRLSPREDRDLRRPIVVLRRTRKTPDASEALADRHVLPTTPQERSWTRDLSDRPR